MSEQSTHTLRDQALALAGVAGPTSALVAPLGFAVLAAGVMIALPAHPHPRFGLANTLTTIRAGLAALLGTLIVEADIVAGSTALARLTLLISERPRATSTPLTMGCFMEPLIKTKKAGPGGRRSVVNSSQMQKAQTG